MMTHVERIILTVKINSMLESILCDYSDAYIPVGGTIKITGEGDNGAAKKVDEKEKGVIIRNCVSLSNYISKINTQTNNAKDIDPMYNLIEYSNNYSKTSESLWQLWFLQWSKFSRSK